MFNDLHSYVAALERAGELTRIRATVDPILEIAEIADRVSKSPAAGAPSRSALATDPRFCGLGGSALLFESVEGSDIPVLINAFGSYRRMEIALGCHEAADGLPPPRVPGGFEGWAARLGALVEPSPPNSLREAAQKTRLFAPLLRIGPRRARAGRCQEVVRTGDDVDLSRLPIIRCWPDDGDLAAVGWPADANVGTPGADLIDDERYRGRYITLAGIHTIHADDEGAARPRSRNIGMYRVQLLGRRLLAMHWHMHHDGARHWRSWKRRGKRMPVAIVLGGQSSLPYAATAPLPPGLSEILMAGLLHGRGIPLVRCKTVPLSVPADAEIVIEGWVRDDAEAPGLSADDLRSGRASRGEGAVIEGPFGDHTGFYSLPDRYPLLEVSAITMRRDAVYPTTIVGLPPQEDYYLGKATERLFRPLLKVLIPDVEDYDLPMFGAFHNCAVLKIRKEYPLQARRAMHSVWGAGQMAWTKHVIVVDDGVDCHDTAAVLREVGRNCLPGRDLELVRGPLDILDHASPEFGAGSKLGFDGTWRWDGERAGGAPHDAHAFRPMPDADCARYVERIRALEGVSRAACPEELGRAWLLVSVRKSQGGDGARIIERVFSVNAGGEASPPRFVVIVDEDVNVSSFDEALFHWCANSDPGRDLYVHRDGHMAAFDATTKMAGDERNGRAVRAFPPILRMDEATRERVDLRWAEYGL